ncbi:MAG TPA: thioesterase family protein [Myxococcales bacterium]|jgi:acyl-CoA thioester hydrolase|nr:thioesterase family protein [Myxococcales bacterium]
MGASDDQRPVLEALFKFSHGHRVRYDEVDAQGIVGNASWLNLLQLGRIEYLRYIGLMLEGGARSPVQPVVRHASVDYLAPARFDDPLAIRVRIAQLGLRSARLEYLVDNLETGLRPLAGQTVIVCVELANMRSMPWPEVWRQRVREFEGENLIVGQG